MDEDIEKIMYDAEFILIIIDGRLHVLKNRNMIKSKDLIKKLEEA